MRTETKSATRLKEIVLRQTQHPDLMRALVVGFGGIAGIALIHVLATLTSFSHPAECNGAFRQ